MDGAKVTGLGHTLIMRAVPIGIQRGKMLVQISERVRVMGTFKEQCVHQDDHEDNILSSGTLACLGG